MWEEYANGYSTPAISKTSLCGGNPLFQRRKRKIKLKLQPIKLLASGVIVLYCRMA